MRRDHPGWGAGLIRVYLAERGLRPPPGESTLRRWFRRAGLAPAPPGRRPEGSARRATGPHQTWQVDATEQVPLGDGTRACWLRVVDEFSGAVLRTALFPLGRWEAVPAAATQAELRRAFARRGLPGRLRVDNGAPWGSTGELPTDLALWLIGLGVEMAWNPPRCPRAHGVVEHSQGTGKRWAEPATCADAAELQRRVDEQDRIRRELYPSIAGRSRLGAFPGLRHSGRPYRAEAEASRWELGRVPEHLAGYVLVRRVDGGGTISLDNRGRYVGTALAGRDVYVTLDPVDVAWVYSSREGVCYRRQAAEELTSERIVALEVSRHRSRTRPRRRKEVAGFPANPPER